jgi:hypothetical protein
MKKVFIVLLLFIFLLGVSSLFRINYFVENLNASDPVPSDTNGYSNEQYYNTELPCPMFCGKYGRTKDSCNNVDTGLRCLDTNGEMITPNCFYSVTNTCMSY